MIDHTGIAVTDYEKSKAFYTQALAPLGYRLLLEVSAELAGSNDMASFGTPPKTDCGISRGRCLACRGPGGHDIEAVCHSASA